MIRMAPLLLVLAACTTPDPAPAPRPAAPSSAEAAVRSACEAEAERAVIYRERGEESRLDRDIGQTDVNNTIPSLRAQSDAYNRRVLREELIRDCIRANTGGPQPVDRSPTTSSRRGRS